jgi:hypothetical protein
LIAALSFVKEIFKGEKISASFEKADNSGKYFIIALEVISEV